MANWNLGSINLAVHALVPDIPTAISGTRMLEIADRKRQFVEDYTGTTIGSNAITITHQDIIVNLVATQTARSMILTGVDASSISLGDFSINKGAGGNLQSAANTFENMAMEQLKQLGRKVSTYQAYYG